VFTAEFLFSNVTGFANYRWW